MDVLHGDCLAYVILAIMFGWGLGGMTIKVDELCDSCRKKSSKNGH